MTKYLLDSNVLMDWLQGRQVAEDLLAGLVNPDNLLAVNDLVLAETYAGLSEDEAAKADPVLARFVYWHTDHAVARLAGQYRYQYERQGRRYAIADMLIGSHAIALDATLVTGNIKDFPMPELKVLRYKR